MAKKRKSSATNSSSTLNKSADQVRRDFEIFAQGIDRLKSLQVELDTIDCTGFEKEEQQIRQKLKTVSEIPSIEIAIKSLKQKIGKKVTTHKRKRHHLHKDVHGLSASIERIQDELNIVTKRLASPCKQDQLKQIKTAISHLRDRLITEESALQNVSKATAGLVTKSQVRSLRTLIETLRDRIDDEHIELVRLAGKTATLGTRGQLQSLKEMIASLDETNKILIQKLNTEGITLKELTTSTKTLSTRSQLQSIKSDLKLQENTAQSKLQNLSKELINIKDQVTVEHSLLDSLTKLTNTLGTKEQAMSINNQLQTVKQLLDPPKGSVDSGIEMLIDTTTHPFLVAIKRALTDRINSKELQLSQTLREDLKNREQTFKKKNQALQDNFQKRKQKLELDSKKAYEKKLSTKLQKEVDQRFNELVKSEVVKRDEDLKNTFELTVDKKVKEILLVESKKQKDESHSEHEEFQKEKKAFFIKAKRIIQQEKKRIELHLSKEFEHKLHQQLKEQEVMFKAKKEALEHQMKKILTI